MAGPVVGARRFAVYPQPPIEPLPVAAGATGEIALSEQLAGPTVGGKPYAQMMFVRVAAHGGAAEPTFMLVVGEGDPVPLSDTASAIHRDRGGVDYVGDGWIDGREPDGVYRIYVGFETVSAAPEQWRLRIRNNDPQAGYRFTAVVADTPEGTLQPWIDVSGGLDFDLLVGQTATKSVGVANFGTVGFSVTGVGQLGPQLTVVTALPVDVRPGGASPVEVRFSAPTRPPAPNGQISGSVAVAITPTDAAATDVPGHNGSLAFHAATRWPGPAFGRPVTNSPHRPVGRAPWWGCRAPDLTPRVWWWTSMTFRQNPLR